mgnify:FL=1
MDLRTKLVFALVLVSLGSMLLLTMLSYGPARDLWRQSALETLEALAESKKLQIAGAVDSWENRVRLVAGRSGLRRLTEAFDSTHSESTRPDIARILADAQASLPEAGIREISLYDTHRDPVATTRSDGLDGVPALDAREVASPAEGVKLLGILGGGVMLGMYVMYTYLLFTTVR